MDQNLNPEQEAQAAVEQVIPQQKKPGRKSLQIFAIVVLLILVAGGVYAWQNNRVAQLNKEVVALKKTTVVTTKTADPYAGWKSYTTKYEKVTFRYPSTFELKDESFVDARPGAIPGVDNFTLAAPSGLKLHVRQGAYDVEGTCNSCKLAQSETIKFFGANNYLNYVSKGNSSGVTTIEVTTTSKALVTGKYTSKNIVIQSDGMATDNLYTIGYLDANQMGTPKPLATFTNDPALAQFKLVLQSFKY